MSTPAASPDDGALPDRVRLVVIFGGRSAEHDVSRVSAANVLAAADQDRYELVPIAITREGRWLLAGDALAELGADRRPPPTGLTVAGTGTDLLPVLAATSTTPGVPTVVMPVLHGPNGEDGTIQGLLELAGIPYVGSGVLGSALSMDKAKAKEVLSVHGVPQTRWRSAVEWEIGDELLTDIGRDLGYPLFVKPANMGSSVGVSKAADPDGLRGAVRAALAHDERLVFEAAVDGREVEIGVLGSAAPRLSVAGEVVPGAEFYDYEDKYLADEASLVIPAALDDDQLAEVRRVALAAYAALRCEILARVDVFVTGTGVLLNEVNTFPGFTPISMFPRLWAATGMSYPQLIDELVRLALSRQRRIGERGVQR